MRRRLPNILLFIVILANLYFMATYIRNNGLGEFLNITGIVFLILGVLIFIFFLSIDPGYGWIKPIDLTKNYIMIFVSMAVSITGIFLIVTGQHLHELRTQKINEQSRCRELEAGNAAEVLKKDWYTLSDEAGQYPLQIYLFQKKSDHNRYKIIAQIADNTHFHLFKSLIISSEVIKQPIHIQSLNQSCQGVFEKDIVIDFDKRQRLDKPVQFDLTITIAKPAGDETSRQEKPDTLQFTLQDKGAEYKQKSGKSSQKENHVQPGTPNLTFSVLFTQQVQA